MTRKKKGVLVGHSQIFLQAVAASGKGDMGMGLTPEAVERIKGLQRGLGMPREIEIAITKEGIVICSDEDFDREAFAKELEAAGIEVVKERVTICG
jgi:hypothetical protein